jgi:hypothetical protein
VGTASQVAYFGTTNSITGSPNFTISGSTMTVTGSLIVSGSGTFTNIGPAVFSGSLTSTAGFTGSFSGTATSASYAATASSADNFLTRGTLTAQTLVVQTITSSVLYSSGSNVFGNSLANTQTFTGSVSITGSALNVNNGGLFVSSSNNVGINTTNPTSPLTVKAGSRSDTLRLTISGSSSVSDAVGITFGSANYDKAQIIAYNENVGNASGYLTFWTGGSPATTDMTERMRITSAGNVGIGTTAPNSYTGYTTLTVNNTNSGSVLDLNRSGTRTGTFYADTSGVGIGSLTATNLDIFTGNSYISLQTNGTERMRISNVGLLTYSGAGVASIVLGASANYANISSGGYGATLYMNGATRGGTGGATSGCVVLATDAFFAITDSSTNNNKMVVTSAGYLKTRTASSVWATTTHRLDDYQLSEGSTILVSGNASQADSIIVYSVSAAGQSSAAAALHVGKSGTTSRSINTGGTVNTSGADYAEYMTKAINDVIAKGDIVGVNSEGKLTNIFNDAISFAVKSTDPAYVGNDTWGNVGALNKPISLYTEEELQQYKATNEAARSTVDRIAFSGQVPCNVTGANVGDYIIPIQLENGKIGGQAVTNPTFEQYQKAVGKVWKIMDNGKAWIAVKIG